MMIENQYFSNKSKYTLKYFNSDTEKKYIDSIYYFKKIQMQYIALLTSFLYAIHLIIDMLILENAQQQIAIFYHSSMVIILILPYITSFYKKFDRLTLYLLYIAPIYAAIGSILLVDAGITYYYADVYMIILWVSILSGFTFYESIIVNIILVSSYIFLMFFNNFFKFEIFLTHIFYIIVAVSFGLLSAFIIGLYRREHFESQEILKKSKRELEETQKKLQEQVNRDPMTNLYNRRYFDEVSKKLINITKREKAHLSIIVIDIDKFKDINDQFGHKNGDDVIKLLSIILMHKTRTGDIVIRFGGEEFVVILPFTDKEGALKIAEKIRKYAEQNTITIDKNKYLKFTISAGVSYFDNANDESIYESLDRADKALYVAKKNGRNKIVLQS